MIIITTYYIYLYANPYYILMYTFIDFFLIGIYLSIFQIELFTAFLWLIECSVIFVFLLLLFYLNIKGSYRYTIKNYRLLQILVFVLYVLLLTKSFVLNTYVGVDISLYGYIENYYEALNTFIQNDLFVFYVSYYSINSIEFILVGFLLLVGSVICVNLYQMNKSIRADNYSNFLTIFNFFSDFSSFFFLRKQNLVLQGNFKAALKVFKKK